MRLYDDLGQAASNDDEFGAFQEVVEDILYRHAAIEPFGQNLENETFDPREQRAVKTVPTSELDLDRTISKVIKFGFKEEDGRVLRAADVEVYKFSKTTPVEENGQEGR